MKKEPGRALGVLALAGDSGWFWCFLSFGHRWSRCSTQMLEPLPALGLRKAPLYAILPPWDPTLVDNTEEERSPRGRGEATGPMWVLRCETLLILMSRMSPCKAHVQDAMETYQTHWGKWWWCSRVFWSDSVLWLRSCQEGWKYMAQECSR